MMLGALGPLLMELGQNHLTPDPCPASAGLETAPRKRHGAVLEHNPHLLVVVSLPLPHPELLWPGNLQLNRQAPKQSLWGFQQKISKPQPSKTCVASQTLAFVASQTLAFVGSKTCLHLY